MLCPHEFTSPFGFQSPVRCWLKVLQHLGNAIEALRARRRSDSLCVHVYSCVCVASTDIYKAHFLEVFLVNLQRHWLNGGCVPSLKMTKRTLVTANLSFSGSRVTKHKIIASDASSSPTLDSILRSPQSGLKEIDPELICSHRHGSQFGLRWCDSPRRRDVCHLPTLQTPNIRNCWEGGVRVRKFWRVRPLAHLCTCV